MSDIFSGILTLNYLVSNLVWSIILTLLARAFEWVRGKPFDAQRRNFFWIICFLSIFVLISVLTYAVRGPGVPDLRGAFDSISFAVLPGNEKAVGLLLVFNVRNVGTPTIVDNYVLTVIPQDREPVEATGLFIPKLLSVPPAPGYSQTLPFPVVCGKDALYRKTGDQPLANGGLARGFLWYQVQGYTPENFKNPTGTKFRMTFRDVLNKKYVADFTWPAVTKSLGYAPGLIIPKTGKTEKPEEACD